MDNTSNMIVIATTIAPRNLSGYLKPVEKQVNWVHKPEPDDHYTPFS